MSRAAVLASASALLVLLLPAVAHGSHVAPAVTLETTLSEPDEKGGGEETLTWDATCGDPADEIAIGIARVMALKGREPVVLRTQWMRDPRQGRGSFTTRVLPGMRWKPRVEVRCRHAGTEEERSATAEAPDFRYLPPLLKGWARSAGEVCGFAPGTNDRKLQARMWAEVTLEALYDENTLLRKPDKGIVLVVRGGGVKKRVPFRSAAAGSFDDPEQFLKFEMPVFKRPGRARVWLEFDGDRSNTLTIPVARLPRGCEEFVAKGA